MRDASPRLPLAADGVQRWVWQSRFGPMLIEVVGDDAYVNGQRVAPFRDAQRATGPHRPG